MTVKTSSYPVDNSHVEHGDGSQVDLRPIIAAIAAAESEAARR